MDRPPRGTAESEPRLVQLDRRDRSLWLLTITLMIALVIVVLTQYFATADASGLPRLLPWESPRELAVSLGGLTIVFCLFLLHRQQGLRELRRRFLLERVRSESLRSRLTELTSLFDAVVRVRAPLDLEPALDTITERVLASLACDGSAILLTDAETGRAVVAARSGSFGGLALPGEGSRRWRAPWDDAVDHEPRILARRELLGEGGFDEHETPGLAFVLCAPLRAGDRSIGTLLLVRLAGREEFSPDEIASFGEFGRQLASVIDRITQFASLQRHAHQLEDANRRLVDLNRMKRIVLSTVNHEVRTPLAGILSYSEMLLQEGESLSPATLREYHEIISGRANALAEFVNELADLLSLESERDGIHFYPASLDAIVGDARMAQAPVAARRGVRIETDVEANLPLVHIDLEKLSRAVRFLVSNAVRFAEPGGGIQISARRQEERESGGRVLLTIRDDGMGSRTGELARVLSPEQARHRAEMHRVEALGLGYYLVREIVELHGGRVWTELEDGSSCVHLSLPAEPAAEESAPAEEPAPAVAALPAGELDAGRVRAGEEVRKAA